MSAQTGMLQTWRGGLGKMIKYFLLHYRAIRNFSSFLQNSLTIIQADTKSNDS